MRLLTRFAYQHLVKRFYCYNSITQLIERTTEPCRDHLKPEIVLRLITPSCKLWYSRGDDLPYPDPYWAFYWPGGQALTRYILDNQPSFMNKIVVDVGCGCGASAIASKLAGARNVIANDIDKVAIEAVQMNAVSNNTNITVSSDNLIGCFCSDWDIVLLGDMFYDDHFVNMISEWIVLLAKKGIAVYIGDPGRLTFIKHPLKSKLEMISKYQLPENCLRENNGMDIGFVWKYISNDIA